MFPTTESYRHRAKARSDAELAARNQPSPSIDQIALAGLRLSPDVRAALTRAAAAMEYFGTAWERQGHALHDQLSLATAIHMDLAILADATAMAAPHPQIAPIFTALAEAATALADRYASRLERKSA